jgi:hypothetical protein
MVCAFGAILLYIFFAAFSSILVLAVILELTDGGNRFHDW